MYHTYTKINILTIYYCLLYITNYLKREILHLVRTNNKIYKRRISDCSLLDEIDQVFGGFLTRKNIGSLIMLMHVKRFFKSVAHVFVAFCDWSKNNC